MDRPTRTSPPNLGMTTAAFLRNTSLNISPPGMLPDMMRPTGRNGVTVNRNPPTTSVTASPAKSFHKVMQLAADQQTIDTSKQEMHAEVMQALSQAVKSLEDDEWLFEGGTK